MVLLLKRLYKEIFYKNEKGEKGIRYFSCGNFSCALMGPFLSLTKMWQYINISVKFTSKPNFTGVQSDDNLDSAQFDTI